MSLKKDLKQMKSQAIDAGWQITKTNGGHLKWLSPDGKTMFYSAGTPSDYCAIANIRSRIKRASEGVVYGKVVAVR